MNRQACRQAIRDWIEARKGRAIAWPPDLSLDGILDSLDFLELLLMIEQQYGLRLNPFDVRPQDLATVAQIADLIATGKPPAPPAPEVLYDNPVEMPAPTPNLLEVLAARGDVAFAGPGLLIASGPFRQLMQRLDSSFADLALGMDAEVWDIPDMLPLAEAERTGYLGGFFDLATFAAAARPGAAAPGQPADYGPLLAPPAHLLNPAPCYSVFLRNQAVELPADLLVTMRGRCFRNEAPPVPDLRRLRNYTVREVVFIGEPDAVSRWRQAWIDRAFGLARSWGLRGRVVAAHDPFFTRDADARKLYQVAHGLKYELVGAMPGADELALASFNLHGDHFTRPFGITRGGKFLHSACVGFGLERWAACFLSQQGPDAQIGP